MLSDAYIESLKREIAECAAMLEPLETGKMHIGERHLGGPWQDCTQAQIDHLKRTIAMLQSIVDRRDA